MAIYAGGRPSSVPLTGATVNGSAVGSAVSDSSPRYAWPKILMMSRERTGPSAFSITDGKERSLVVPGYQSS
ncbi:Uncharacterised protein [Mycobacteroides abscessus subsp. abscessus]|nr:Uncharacterised protein [Mycobacteroides abscessus subsp. abscessus]